MKYYTSTTQFNCGIDLHAHQMYVCLMDRDGKKLVHTNIRNNDFEFFLKLIEPYRHDLTVCAECMFGWYWLADACQASGLTFVLAHALYLKAIHGGKNKNDRIDSEKIAHLLRSNLIPPSYVYPWLPTHDATMFDRQDQTTASRRNTLLLGGLNHREDFQFGLLADPLDGYRSHEPPLVFFAGSPVRPTDPPECVPSPGVRA
jgi:hypothetical protein